MTKIENSVINISIRVKLTVSDLDIAKEVYYDTDEEKLVDSNGRIWAPLMMLENIGIREHKILTTDWDFKEKLGLSIEEYKELETYISKE